MTLVVRHHVSDDGTESSAEYSACDKYRYALTRIWNGDQPRLLYVMLNPSKATELANDPTIERCERRARALGYGAIKICNLFAWKDTDPARLKRAKAPVGPANDHVLEDGAKWADDVLCAWGVHGTHLARDKEAALILRNSGRSLLALGTTKDGHPRHPLYVAYATKPTAYDLPVST